jgi:23S rRNA (guanosine2251-2'-O)-methyltransferase
MTNRSLRLILSDIRSAYNVGAILRTADACAVEVVYACGYTPYPRTTGDNRPEHVISANTRDIAKTALGAESSVRVLHSPSTTQAIREARTAGFTIIMLEQAEGSLNALTFQPPNAPLTLVVGNEVTGLSPDDLALADHVLELPMLGRKESLNVSVATGIALYRLRFS